MAKFLLCVLVFALCFVSTQSRPIFIDSRKVYNVVDYGAVGDGLADDTKAFMDAWKATCKSSTSSPTMHVPQGMTFWLQPLTFNGNCKSNNITVQIDGTIIAPGDPSAWKCPDDKCLWGPIVCGFGPLAYGEFTDPKLKEARAQTPKIVSPKWPEDTSEDRSVLGRPKVPLTKVEYKQT